MLRTLVNVDPNNEFRSIEELFDRFFGQPSRPVPGPTTLPVDILERDGAVLVKAAVPGVDPNELEVTVENNVLSIRGETRQDTNSENDKVYRREVSYGAFSRSIRLPDKLDLSAVTADFQHGVVTISIPRLPEAKLQSLKVPVRVSEPTQAITTGAEGQEEAKN